MFTRGKARVQFKAGSGTSTSACRSCGIELGETEKPTATNARFAAPASSFPRRRAGRASEWRLAFLTGEQMQRRPLPASAAENGTKVVIPAKAGIRSRFRMATRLPDRGTNAAALPGRHARQRKAQKSSSPRRRIRSRLRMATRFSDRGAHAANAPAGKRGREWHKSRHPREGGDPVALANGDSLA